MCGFVTMPAYAGLRPELIPTGTWGGDHIRLVVSATGATIEYDCAHGTIDEQLLLKEDGSFEAIGVNVFDRGGLLQP